MRQLITRLDDDLHARLKDAARAEGRSVNAFVVDALERATAKPPDAWAAVRRRLVADGAIVVPPARSRVPSREEVAAATRGSGQAVSDALRAERDAR